MKKLCVLVPCVLLVACGSESGGSGSSWSVTITDHADAVTTSSGDNLFALHIDAAPDETTPLTKLLVSLKKAGQTGTVLRFDLTTDTDADGALGAGDVLTCREPPANLVGPADVGTDYIVGLSAQTEPTVYLAFWSGIWTAK